MKRDYLISISLILLVMLGSNTVAVAGEALTLDDAISRALATHETVAQAGEAIRAAEAGLLEARAGRLPHLDASGQLTHNIQKPSFFIPGDMAAAFGGSSSIEMGGDYDLSGAVSASMNLWTAGRLSAATGMAREYLAATKYQEAAARDYIRYQVRAIYSQALLATENLRIQEKALSAVNEAARVARAGFDAGTVSQFDVQRAEVELANRRPLLVESSNAVDQALLALGQLCGLTAGVLPEPIDPLRAAAPPRSVNELLNLMRTNSPEIQTLEQMLAVRGQQVNLQEAARGPMLQLVGQYVWQGQWDDDLFPAEDDLVTSANVALAVSIPIFDGLETKAKIQSARSNLRTAQLELERVYREKETAVRQARLQLESALAALDGREEAVLLAEEAHRLALVRLENGLATPLERLDAESAMTTAQAQLAAALYYTNIAEANLELAIGQVLHNTETTSRRDENE